MPGEVTNHNRDREADCEVLSSPRSESDLALERAVLHFLPRLVTPLQVYTLLSVVIGHLVRELATLEGLTAASRALPMATVAGAVRPGNVGNAAASGRGGWSRFRNFLRAQDVTPEVCRQVDRTVDTAEKLKEREKVRERAFQTSARIRSDPKRVDRHRKILEKRPGYAFTYAFEFPEMSNPPYLEIGGFDSVPKILVAFPLGSVQGKLCLRFSGLGRWLTSASASTTLPR
eukprot:1184621-Prorocentrum_minimum.AAC.2